MGSPGKAFHSITLRWAPARVTRTLAKLEPLVIGPQARALTTTARRLLAEHAVVLYAFVASRLALLAVGLLTLIHIRPFTTTGNVVRLSDHQVLNIWGAWDTGWYTDLALYGYQRTPGLDGAANWAFFPAFPGLANALSHLSGLTLFQAMLLISNLAFLAALVLIHRLARDEFDDRTADLAVLLLCAAPGSYIFSSAYTEALFLAAMAGALVLMRDRRWLAAGAVTALAVMTRNLGVGLLLPYAWLGLQRLRSAERPRMGELARIGVGGLIPVATLLAFLAYMKARTGDALAFVHIQRAWKRTLGDPFSPLLNGLLHPSNVHDAHLPGLAAGWLAVGLLFVLAAMRRWSLLPLAMFLTLAPLAAGVASFARYALVILPLWLVAAKLLADRPKLAGPVVVTLAILNGFMMVTWTLMLWISA